MCVLAVCVCVCCGFPCVPARCVWDVTVLTSADPPPSSHLASRDQGFRRGQVCRSLFALIDLKTRQFHRALAPSAAGSGRWLPSPFPPRWSYRGGKPKQSLHEPIKQAFNLPAYAQELELPLASCSSGPRSQVWSHRVKRAFFGLLRSEGANDE